MITGSLVAIITPMHEDGRLDLARFKKLIDWHVEEGTDGVVIVGIKDATANIERGTDLIKRAPRNFAIYSGDDATALALILLGGHGVISVTANVAPKLMRQMCAAALVGDVKKARELNLKLFALHQRLFVEANPIPVKWALAEMGMIEYGLRLPLAPMSDKFYKTVREALHEAGIALPGLRVVEGRG